ncbi:MAG: FKBP-type peptidyl-prolyl cis-trans isomerase [Gemmatimonadota bacterium]
MRIRLSGAALGLALAVAACQSGGDEGTPSLQTNDQKASYAIGLNWGRQLLQVSDKIDLASLRAGIRDGIGELDPAIADADIQGVMEQFGREVDEAEASKRETAATKNQEEGQAYLAENGQKEGVLITASGLQYEVLRAGSGPKPGPENQVRVHYRGTLLDGKEFDSSYARGEPAVFAVGQVIPGFAEGLQLMETGSQYRFVLPGDIAYGPGGAGADIGPNATLIFEVELLEILP